MKQFWTIPLLCLATMVGAGSIRAQTNATPPTAADPEGVLLATLPDRQLPDLQAALQRAMQQSSRVVNSLLDLDQAKAGELQARSPMLPYASLSANLGVAQNKYEYDAFQARDANGKLLFDTNGVPVISPQSSKNGVVQDLSYNAGLNQPVFYWGALKKGFQSAQLQKAIASRNVEEIRRNLAIEVRRSYFTLINLSNSAEMEKATLARYEEEWEFLKKQAADGFVIGSVARAAETKIKSHKLQMERSRNAFEAQWQYFCDLTGLDRGTPMPAFPKEIPTIQSDLKPIFPKLAAGAEGYTPINIQNANDSIRVEKLNYEIATTRLKPRVGVGINASRGYHSPDLAMGLGGPYMLTSVGVNANVNWAVFDGFSTKAAKQSSRIRMRQLERSRDQSMKEYDESLKNNLTNLRLNYQPLLDADESLTSSRSSVETARKDYELGVVQKQTVETYETYVDSALAAANNARADYYIQIVNYLSLRGKDPAVNYRPENSLSHAPKN
ncbi:MAG: TolC family protein [Nibricoccus sp.]